MSNPNSNSSAEESDDRSFRKRSTGPKFAFIVIACIVLIAMWVRNQDKPGDVGPGGGAERPKVEGAAKAERNPRAEEEQSKTPRDSAPRDHRPSHPRIEATESAPPKRDLEDDAKIPDVVVHDQRGNVIFEGTVDLQPTLDRIEAGERLPYAHDGAIFQNREGRLPKKPQGYYHEYVQLTPREAGPGPQRVVIGRNGEIFYTPDHYKTFRRIR